MASPVTHRPLLHSIQKRCSVTGLSRSTIYTLIRRDEIVAVKAGRRVLVTDESLQRYVASLAPAKLAPEKPRKPLKA